MAHFHASALLLIAVGSLLVACGDDEGPAESSGGSAPRSGGNGGAMATGGTSSSGGSGGATDSGGAGGTSSGGASPGSGGGPTGDTCGGIIGAGCPTGMYCAYPLDAMCGAADQLGTCQPRPQVCTMEFAPVCGCDGNTYGNACAAATAGVSVASEGECSS